MPQAPFHQPDSGGNSVAAVTGLVHSVESCGTVDGPGIRFVLFLSGCSLRCRYCHNPDASSVRRGKTRSAADILEAALPSPAGTRSSSRPLPKPC